MTTVIYKDLATSKQRRNRFEIPLLAANLRAKFSKEQTLVHKAANKLVRNSEQFTSRFSYLLLAFYTMRWGRSQVVPL